GQVLQLVHGRNREVALFVARAVTQARLAAVPDAFLGIDLVKRPVAGLVKADFVEDVQLSLEPKVDGVANARALQILFGLLGNVSGILGVRLTRNGVLDVAHHAERRDLAGWVDNGGIRVGQEQHVALIDLLETANGRAVEAKAIRKRVLRQLGGGDRKVLPGTWHV